MAQYFKYLNQLLTLSGENFEEELQRLVSIFLMTIYQHAFLADFNGL